MELNPPVKVSPPVNLYSASWIRPSFCPWFVSIDKRNIQKQSSTKIDLNHLMNLWKTPQTGIFAPAIALHLPSFQITLTTVLFHLNFSVIYVRILIGLLNLSQKDCWRHIKTIIPETITFKILKSKKVTAVASNRTWVNSSRFYSEVRTLHNLTRHIEKYTDWMVKTISRLILHTQWIYPMNHEETKWKKDKISFT